MQEYTISHTLKKRKKLTHMFFNNIIKDIMRTTHRRENDPEKPTNEWWVFFTLRMFKKKCE